MTTVRKIETLVAQGEVGNLLFPQRHRQAGPVVERRVHHLVARESAPGIGQEVPDRIKCIKAVQVGRQSDAPPLFVGATGVVDLKGDRVGEEVVRAELLLAELEDDDELLELPWALCRTCWTICEI